MDYIGPLTLIFDLYNRVSGAMANRPKLKIDTISFRPDQNTKRWIFRASVFNYGRVEADYCEGFWSIFDHNLKELSCGTSVFWSPKTDDDYDYRDRSEKRAKIRFNERRFCWAEYDIVVSPKPGSNNYFFPYNTGPGIFTFAIIIEYGQYKSFDWFHIYLPQHIFPSMPIAELNECASWGRPKGLKGYRLKKQLWNHIRQVDYHNYVRPT